MAAVNVSNFLFPSQPIKHRCPKHSNPKVEAFLTYLADERGLAKNTIASYRFDVQDFVGAFAKPLATLSRQDVRSYLATRMQTGRAARSLARRLSAIRHFCRWLLDEGILTIDPTLGIPVPKTWKTVPHSLTVAEIQAMLDGLETASAIGLRDRAMLVTCFASGLRISELLALGLVDLDLEHSIISVRHGKGAKDRIAPLNPAAITALRTYLAIGRPPLLNSESSPLVFVGSPNAPNFPGYGQPLSRQFVWQRFRELAQRTIGKKISPHWLRHSFGTVLIKGGADIRAVQAMMGHAGIDTTQIYLDIDLRALRETYYATHPLARRTHAAGN